MLGRNLKVAHQGLIIILVPMLCELSALTMIMYLLDQSDRAFKQEAVSKEIMEEANSLNKTLYDGGEAMLQYFYTRDTSEINKFRQRADSMRRTLDRLEKLSQGDYERLERIHLLKRNGESMMEIFFTQGLPRGFIDEAKRPGNIKGFRDKITDIYGPLLGTIQDIVTQERRALQARMKEGREYADRLKTVVWAAIVFSIITSISLVLYFSKRITYRLGVVHGNLGRFLRHEQLGARVDGRDEIADLDRAFHQMTETVRHLEKSKQEFVSMISHDIRSPLAAVQGSLALFADDRFGSIDESGKERLARNEHNIDKVMRLLNDLLTIDKIESGSLSLEYVPLQLHTLVEEALSILAPLCEARGLTLVNDCKEIEFEGDAMRLEQVIVNLAGNAIKYSPDNEKIIISGEADEDTVTVSIKDNGRGIPDHLLQKVFDRFQQVEAKDETEHQGFGLGLSICQGIIAAHRGEISVESRLSEGSTFSFTIPRYESD